MLRPFPAGGGGLRALEPWRGYWRIRLQSLLLPLFQHPVLTQIACRAPQFVMQVVSAARSGILLQSARQDFCTLLHLIGSACAAGEPSKASPTMAAAALKILCCTDGVLSRSYGLVAWMARVAIRDRP